MSILEVVQDVSKRLGLDSPSTVVGNTDKGVIQLLALFEEGGREIASRYNWPQLNKEALITLVASQDGYDLPDDFNFRLDNTDWDRSNSWPTIGMVSAEDWQRWKSGVSTTPNRKLARVKGPLFNKYTLHPVPDSGDAGETMVYEFQSKNWLRPSGAWTTSTSYSTNDYVYSSDGHIYKATNSATSGATEPTHTDGTASDGAVTWQYVKYDSVTADTDVSVLDEELMKKELLWRWRRAKRLEYAAEQNEAMGAWKAAFAGVKGLETINLAGNRRGYLISYGSIPESGYGS